MPHETLIAAPGPAERTVRTADGRVLDVPAGWVLVPPGDPGLTRRVKAAGPTWTMQEKRGRKLFSRGVWADQANVKRIATELAAERATPAYARKQAAAGERREREQAAYVESFEESVVSFLCFAPPHATLARHLAKVVAAHATPVGSGTVARTERIPIERRAEAAVIAWLRHQTTAYDSLKIPRVKGKRREVRRMLAEQSRILLEGYRRGQAVDPARCPLRQALAKLPAAASL
ncbi:MAG: DUF2293 domain-containing protein [Pirellula sp.]|nr:DUF2293 domain-containing protein [Pirellula sp.]